MVTRTMPLLDQSGTPDAAGSPQPKTRAVLTDSHFLIPVAVFLAGLALLITLH